MIGMTRVLIGSLLKEVNSVLHVVRILTNAYVALSHAF